MILTRELAGKLSIKKVTFWTLVVLTWGYIGAFILPDEWRLIENLIAASCAWYCAYMLIASDDAFISWSLAVLCLAAGFNMLNESFWNLYSIYGWEPYIGIPYSADLYAFGNHVRNPAFIIASLMLAGVLSNLSRWLNELVNGE